MDKADYTSEEEDGTWWVCLEAGVHWAGQGSAVRLQSKETTTVEHEICQFKCSSGVLQGSLDECSF